MMHHNTIAHTKMDEIYFEGGDVVLHKSEEETVYFIGISSRTSKSGFEFIQSQVTHRCIPLTLISSVYYHLDTCFFPVGDVLLVAEKPEKIFSADSSSQLMNMFKTIIIAREYSDDPWTCCNARYLRTKKTAVFSCYIPEPLLFDMRRLLPDIAVRCLDLQSLMVGGGGLACSTLLDEKEEIVLVTDPTSCDLTKYTLNSFQKGMQEKAEVKTDLSSDISSIVRTFEDLGVKVIQLPSHPDVPECVFIKDVCLLIRRKGELRFLLCRTSISERKEESEWFRKALTRKIKRGSERSSRQSGALSPVMASPSCQLRCHPLFL